MSGRSDCRKFAPNIFNKSKCTNCFRQKEEHSAEALESNRASRKISKCGYLFVAPGWDFSNPLYRTKRWQRRWFVLYDDGELTYSLDEHPDTVPQASIDMTTVLEVSEADSVTGHSYSLAITAPERVTFVKGTCREEARWWSDVLSVYPRSKGRHKRNATFPGGQTASLLQSSTTRKYSADASTLRDVADGCQASRPRYCSGGTTTWPGPRVQPPQPEIPSLAAPTPIDTKVYTDQPVSSASPPTRDKINGEEKARSRRRDTWAEPSTPPVTDDATVGVRSPLLQHQHQQYDEQLRDIAASLTRPRSRRALPPTLERPTRLPPPDRLPARGSPDGGAPPEEASSSSASEGSEPTDAVEPTENGEGGRVELPAERLLHARAGWLQRRGPGGWSRHWFVLRGAALLYFRDPHAEHRGLMDGVIDLSGISRVVELPNSTNGYAFETETWDGKHIVLSAVTAGIRANWVSAMRRTAGLPDTGPLSLILREDTVDQASESSTSPVTPVTPITGRSAPFSSDEEYRTASEGGRRDSADWGDMGPQPPPSPLLTRTPISKVKEKVRIRSSHQAPPRADTPKGDRDEIDSTKEKDRNVDDVDENEKPVEARKRSYISTIDKQSIEIDDLRKQLKLALSDVGAAEAEISRLQKLKTEAAMQEKKMEELVTALQKKEEELSVRTKEAENLDAIKELYNQDKSLWENKLTETQNFLKESTEHCELLTRQLASAQETIAQLQREVNELNEKLLKSVRESDSLYSRIRDLEGRTIVESTLPSKEKRKSIGSLSDLTNLNQDLNLEAMEKDKLIEEYGELRDRFVKAIQEIKAMKKELRDSHNMYDELEVTNMKLRNEMKLREQCSRSEIDLMAARILDLTQKLTASDKQVRTLKHKIQKSESREKRRSLSLKGRESFTLGKEVEEKLTELENKITMLESGEPVPTINSPSKSASPAKEKSSKSENPSDEKRMKRLAARLRRKSLDSATSSEPMKMLVRLSSLETKVASALENRKDLTNSCESLSQATRSVESPSLNESTEASSIGTQSQRHLLERLQSLENVVIHSRNKVNECLCQMSAMRAAKSRRSPSPSLEKKYSLKSMEKCLTDVSKRLQECFDKCVVDYDHNQNQEDVNDSVAQVVVQLEEQLRTKLLEISKRKAALYEAGELTQRKSLEILAEKLAYEAVLVGRIQEALESSNGSRFFARLIKSEIIETSQLIDNLKRKINGESSRSSAGTRSSLDYLAMILTRKIDIVNGSREAHERRRSELIIHGADLEALKASQREVAEAVDRYKSEKLAELCSALACETLSYSAPADGDTERQRANLEAARVREAWAAARDALGAELVQAEVTRALARAAASCDQRLDQARRARLTLTAQDRADLELWWQAAHDHLRCEMDAAVKDIAARYRSCLAAERRPREGSPGLDSRALLQQLAEALAQRALVDARVAVLDGTYRASSPREAAGPRRSAEDTISSLEADPAQEAEFVYLFQRFSTECRALFSSDCSGNSEDSMKIGESLERVEAAVAEVQRQLGARGEEPAPPAERGATPTGASVLDRIDALRRRVEALQALVPCQHCKQLQDALDRLHEERTRGECALAQQAHALAAARRARAQLQAQHERERAALRERARTLQRRLAALDSEYSAQLENLRAAYQSAVAADTHGDGLRARYQQEIEQLRALCEKGLLAMESSHRRIVREMEDKHRAEREQLRLDKEQALAEETRATLAALDAMRKAHESEVRREVDKFKAEFLSRGHNGDLTQLSSRHHNISRQEMEEIKREILSLSEKYSVKCVESAALEERLATATAQLAQAHNHIMQLDARNKQLRAHLISEANEMKNTEASALSQLIEETGPHGRAPALREEWRHLATARQKPAADKDEVVPRQPTTGGGPAGAPGQDTVRKDGKHAKPATVARSELKASKRSAVSGRPAISPLAGMVAERKKRFEL
ncbi:protein outspread isoform X2 [Spodoptera frugiperda]|uniref:Protein outspread isoform X2 n=1 Tax=Spodoptera frugiperda TaxID=7108 RepID=A0A9R0EI58_SPOFR|nr:protein outspread isoform X2 [Spodoptera frugiperda]